MAKRLAGSIRRIKAWLMDYAYLVTLGAVIAVVAASAIYTRQVRAKQAQDVAAAAQAPEIAQTSAPVPSVSPMPTIAPLQVRYMQLGGVTVWPVSGRVIREYDAHESVYWEAIGSYRVHTGLDIEGRAGEDVLCAADGVVRSAARDALWGWRVTIDQMDGRQAVYAGLYDVSVTEGQSITRGQRIGALLDAVPCEAEMGPHLHMELYRDGKAQDPEGMMPER